MVGIFCCFFLGNAYASISIDTLVDKHDLPPDIKAQIEQYTVTQIFENNFATVALAHDRGDSTKTKVFAWHDADHGGKIDKKTQTLIS